MARLSHAVFLFLLFSLFPRPAIANQDFAACKLAFAKAAGELFKQGEGLRPITDLSPKVRQIFANTIKNAFAEKNLQKQPIFLREFLQKASAEDKKRFEEMVNAIHLSPGPVSWQMTLLGMGREVDLNRLSEGQLPEFERLRAEFDYFTAKYGKFLVEQTIKFRSAKKGMETWARDYFHEWGVWVVEFEDGTTKSFTFPP